MADRVKKLGQNKRWLAGQIWVMASTSFDWLTKLSHDKRKLWLAGQTESWQAQALIGWSDYESHDKHKLWLAGQIESWQAQALIGLSDYEL